MRGFPLPMTSRQLHGTMQAPFSFFVSHPTALGTVCLPALLHASLASHFNTQPSWLIFAKHAHVHGRTSWPFFMQNLRVPHLLHGPVRDCLPSPACAKCIQRSLADFQLASCVHPAVLGQHQLCPACTYVCMLLASSLSPSLHASL